MPLFDLDATADTLTAEIPEPQQHAIDQAIADEARQNPGSDTAVELDELGIPWNSAEHATGPDGKGIRTVKGAWRKRRGLKGSASHLNTGAAKPAEAPPEDPSIAQTRTLEHQNRMAGAMAGTMLVRISAAIGGKEFLPRTITVPGGLTYHEEQFLQTAFGDYFVAKGITDIPPGMVLCSALCMYFLPRFQEPAVRERSGRFVRWMKERFVWVYLKWKYRRGGKPPDRVERQPSRETSDNVSSIPRKASFGDV